MEILNIPQLFLSVAEGKVINDNKTKKKQQKTSKITLYSTLKTIKIHHILKSGRQIYNTFLLYSLKDQGI